MSNTAWGNLLLPGIRNWALNEFPHVFLEVRLHEDMMQDACVFGFKLVHGIWVTVTIYNEFFYDSKNPTEEIMAVIKGQFAELLAPQIKSAFSLGMKVTENMLKEEAYYTDWTVPYVIEVLKVNFPDYTFYAKALGPSIIRILTHFGKKTYQATLTTTWLNQHGIDGFLAHMTQLLGLSYKPKPGEYASKPKPTKMEPGFVEWVEMYLNYPVQKVYSYPYLPEEVRRGQFYEDGENWIPVGLTLADIT